MAPRPPPATAPGRLSRAKQLALGGLRARVRLLSGSLVRRYSLLLLIATVAPMAMVGLVYDRYMRSLLDQFTGERLQAQLAATASRISAFLDARTYQLEQLARYPVAPLAGRAGPLAEELISLARLEADEADLYGVLVFGEAHELLQVIPGQAASGSPYWAGSRFDSRHLPVSDLGEAKILGPVPPRDGQSGWFLLQEPLHGGGHIALHVRFSSVTELLGAPSIAGVLEPVLKTPAGYFDVVGTRQPSTGTCWRGQRWRRAGARAWSSTRRSCSDPSRRPATPSSSAPSSRSARSAGCSGAWRDASRTASTRWRKARP